MTVENPPAFPEELFVIENEVECASHVGHSDLVEIAQSTSAGGEMVCKYRRVGKPFQIDMENRQQHRVIDGNGKAITSWTTWESGHGSCENIP